MAEFKIGIEKDFSIAVYKKSFIEWKMNIIIKAEWKEFFWGWMRMISVSQIKMSRC